MNPDDLIKATAKALPEIDISGSQCTPITNGGSDRDYFRLTIKDKSSFIIMRYTADRQDNLKFVSSSKILKKIGHPPKGIVPSSGALKKIFGVKCGQGKKPKPEKISRCGQMAAFLFC